MKNQIDHTKRPFHTHLLLTLIYGATLLLLTHIPALNAENGRPDSENAQLYLPLVVKPLDCGIADASYSSLPIASDPITRPAWDHPDINLAVRGYEEVSASLMLVDYGGGTDANAPQLDTLFSPARVPIFTNAYQIYRWDWACNCRLDLMSTWPTTLLGMGTSEGDPIHVPDSGYDIGGGNDVMVLYATDNRITLKYTREDNVVLGYTVHIEDVCVDPALVSLYVTLDAAGRAQLPVLAGGQAFGRALGDEIKVSIRDTGNFLDPRSRKDWWQNQ
ncbi:hypothetical protein [Candidatus Leptofilum sp.]|uniref:hypothetical protein n=1 Tax=Candidatus Leptofilum sp. TaxID=3241576 RepID=UPI003B59C76B